MKRRAANSWSLRLKLSYVVVLSAILVIVVTVNKIRSIKSRSSPAPVGFRHNSSERSTMDIINFCIGTMIICTFSVMHFNVPQRTVHGLGFRKKIISLDFWAEAWISFFYWSVGLLVPELLAMMSCAEYYHAVEDYAIMQSLCPGWTIQHSFFASMRGFTLEDGDDIHSGQGLYENGAILTESGCERYSYEIKDKAKTNILTKAIAILQISRFLLGEIDRACNGLPISPLSNSPASRFSLLYYLLAGKAS